LLVGALPIHLHVPTLAIGILIVAGQLFWHTNGKRPGLQAIQRYMELYCTLGTADAVRTAVVEGFKTVTGPYTKECALELILITLDNLGGEFQGNTH